MFFEFLSWWRILILWFILGNRCKFFGAKCEYSAWSICSSLPSDRGGCWVSPSLWWPWAQESPWQLCRGARTSERKLPALGTEQRCYEMSQPSSLFLPGGYKAQMYNDVWTNTKNIFFLIKERHEFPPFSVKSSLWWSLERKRDGSHIWKTFAHSYKM